MEPGFGDEEDAFADMGGGYGVYLKLIGLRPRLLPGLLEALVVLPLLLIPEEGILL
jgi:hypothetical protein